MTKVNKQNNTCGKLVFVFKTLFILQINLRLRMFHLRPPPCLVMPWSTVLPVLKIDFLKEHLANAMRNLPAEAALYHSGNYRHSCNFSKGCDFLLKAGRRPNAIGPSGMESRPVEIQLGEKLCIGCLRSWGRHQKAQHKQM